MINDDAYFFLLLCSGRLDALILLLLLCLCCLLGFVLMEFYLCVSLLSLSLDAVKCVEPFEARLEETGCSLAVDSIRIDCSGSP